jgi:peptidoglycan/LPS O-acetylase OafA/YrhL
MQQPNFPKNNNIEWLRLAFALQVVIGHASLHLHIPLPGIIGWFPGVPAFFFVSGFLIYASYINSPGPDYFKNRFLRLYPGLAFVTLGALVLAIYAHGGQDLLVNLRTYLAWLLAQLTLGQAYNPAHFRDVGVGVLNGALWTLTVEILFYLAVPLIAKLERHFRHTVPVLTLTSFAIYALGPGVWNATLPGGKSLYDLLAITPVAWGWMFGLGIMAAQHFQVVSRWLRYGFLGLVPMLLMFAFGHGLWFGVEGNRVGIFYFFFYIGFILWLAFGTPYRHLRLDLSYGTYIWHSLVINLLVILQLKSIPLTLGLTLAMALASWFLIEKPALKLKRRTLRPAPAQASPSAGAGGPRGISSPRPGSSQ